MMVRCGGLAPEVATVLRGMSRGNLGLLCREPTRFSNAKTALSVRLNGAPARNPGKVTTGSHTPA